jgi:hypothetical protein
VSSHSAWNLDIFLVPLQVNALGWDVLLLTDTYRTFKGFTPFKINSPKKSVEMPTL